MRSASGGRGSPLFPCPLVDLRSDLGGCRAMFSGSAAWWLRRRPGIEQKRSHEHVRPSWHPAVVTAVGDDDEQLSFDARAAAKAHDQYGLISRAQVLELGASDSLIHRRMTERVWLPARLGVYRMAAVGLSWHQSVMAACLQIPGAVAYGRTAGWLWGLEGLGKSAPTRIELAVERSRNPRCLDLDIYRVRKLTGEWTRRDAVPVTHLPRTLIDLAGLLDEAAAELALDSAMRSRPGLKSWLGRELAKYPPHCTRGPHRLRKLLDLRRSPSDSALEVRWERIMRKAHIPEPTYRSPVFDENGRIGSIDYIWADHRIVLQTHGWQWHGHRQRWQTDIVQRRRMGAAKWQVVEVTRADLDNPEPVLAILRKGLGIVAPFSSDVRTKTEPGWV